MIDHHNASIRVMLLPMCMVLGMYIRESNIELSVGAYYNPGALSSPKLKSLSMVHLFFSFAVYVSKSGQGLRNILNEVPWLAPDGITGSCRPIRVLAAFF